MIVLLLHSVTATFGGNSICWESYSCKNTLFVTRKFGTLASSILNVFPYPNGSAYPGTESVGSLFVSHLYGYGIGSIRSSTLSIVTVCPAAGYPEPDLTLIPT